MAILTITHTDINSGNPVFIQGKQFSMTYNKKSMADPNANYSEDEPVVRVQTKSIENPLYIVTAVVLYEVGDTIGGITAMTEDLLKEFYTLANDDSDPIILNYTDNNSIAFKSLQKYSGSRTVNIPVTLNGQLKIDSAMGTNMAKLQEIGVIQFKETKKV